MTVIQLLRVVVVVVQVSHFNRGSIMKGGSRVDSFKYNRNPDNSVVTMFARNLSSTGVVT